VSATQTCASCLQPLREGELTRSLVSRGFYDDQLDAPSPLCLDVIEVHADCDDPKGRHIVRLPHFQR
jgi:hypothetical protein